MMAGRGSDGQSWFLKQLILQVLVGPTRIEPATYGLEGRLSWGLYPGFHRRQE